MTHFNTDNRILVTLGAPPQLASPAFPLDADFADRQLMATVCGMLGIAERPR